MATILQPGDQPTISTAIGLAVYNGVWLGALCALAIAVVLLSTVEQRRGAVFAVQCLAFPMAFCSALVHVVQNAETIDKLIFADTRRTALFRLQSATKFFELFTPLVCDITLLFKVLSFYPPTLYPTTIRRIGPVIPLIILALLRAASCSLGVATVALSQSSDREYLDSYDYTIFDMIEYGLQVIFCIYSSILLFRKLFKIANHRRLGHTSLPRKRKVRILIEATAMTFIFPILAQIGAVVSAATGQGVFYCYFAYSNIYLSVICSVLATSWSTIRNTRDTGSPPTNNSSIGHHPLFSRARWLRRRPCRDGRGTKTGQVEEDSKSTTSSEREARQIDTVGRMEAGDEVDPMTSIRAIAPHDTLLSSIFDEALPADDVGITSSRAQSEAMEMLASSVHGHTHSSSSLDDAWLPQSIDRPSQVRRRASFRHSVVRRQ